MEDLIVEAAEVLTKIFLDNRGSGRYKSEYLQIPGFKEAYIRVGRGELIFSNITVLDKGKGFFSGLIEELRAIGLDPIVECPHSRLNDWCVRNNVTVKN